MHDFRQIVRLVNARTGAPVAGRVEVAMTRAARRKGLLGRESLEPGAALWLSPCCMVHTAFMRFAIDVVFLGADDDVVRIVRNVPPWRIALAFGANSVVELAAGAARADLRIGDRLCPSDL